MSVCCVSSCKNQCFPNSTLKFYRLPIKPKRRRRLWLQALQQVNGSTEGLNGHVRVCGAHFISGEASMDHNSPDFVPSVFTSIKPTPKKKVNRVFGQRRSLRHKTNLDNEEIPASTPAEPKEEETLAKEPEDETKTKPVASETKSSPVKSLQSLKLPAGISNLDKMNPVVLIKPLPLPAGQYKLDLTHHHLTSIYNNEARAVICENCGKQYTTQADFIEHQCFQNVPANEPSFPCNMCDKFFTTSHNLKRHKLLHVRDGRKCSKCGVLFCKRHRHVLFVPQAETVTEYEQESSADELQNEGSDEMPENSSLQESEEMETYDVDDDAEGSTTVTPVLIAPRSAPPLQSPAPLSIVFTAPLPVPNTIIVPQNAIPVFRKPFPVLLPRPPAPSTTSSQPPPPEPPEKPVTFGVPECTLPPNIELPSSLKIFSPKFLTSALLEVKRNYKYILNRGVKEVPIVKEEPCELPVDTPLVQSVAHEQSPPHEQNVAHEQSSEQVKKERTAYDLEIEI